MADIIKDKSHSYSIDEAIDAAYLGMLGRKADMAGQSHWKNAVTKGSTLDQVFSNIFFSNEAAARMPAERKNVINPLEALHIARIQMVRQLPKASVIVDLGGGAIGDPRGALVAMGYPYKFTHLSIIEPPPALRHEIYKDIPDLKKTVETELGIVDYVYTSMANLSQFKNESVDLVLSGETIEHVTVEDCKKTLEEVRRVLKPNGFFCFDTPNRKITKIQCPTSYINPDHKIEYTHDEMVELLNAAGLKIVETKGITYMPKTRASNRFFEEDMMQNIGMYADFEGCYMLYYKCQPQL